MKINESNAERVEGGKEEKQNVVIRLEERERVGRMWCIEKERKR